MKETGGHFLPQWDHSEFNGKKKQSHAESQKLCIVQTCHPELLTWLSLKKKCALQIARLE
jgi:hypothetical protein